MPDSGFFSGIENRKIRIPQSGIRDILIAFFNEIEYALCPIAVFLGKREPKNSHSTEGNTRYT
jgi:hypothetical protein